MSLRDWTKISGAFRISEFTKANYGNIYTDVGMTFVGNIINTTTNTWSFTTNGSTSTFLSNSNVVYATGRRYKINFDILSTSGTLTSGDLFFQRFTNVNIYLDDSGVSIHELGSHTITITCTKTSNAYFQLQMKNTTTANVVIRFNFIEEIDPLPTITIGTKYLECTSNGIIKINHNTTTDADASIDYYDGASWATFSGKLSDLITTHAWLSKDGNYLEFSLTTGQAIANIKIYDGVRQ